MRIADGSGTLETAGADLDAGGGRVILHGRWTADQGPAVERASAEIAAQGRSQPVLVDLSGLARLDTLGAWVLERTRAEIEAAGGRLAYAGARPEHRILLGEMGLREPEPAPRDTRNPLVRLLDGTGRRVARGGNEILSGIAFLGEVVAAGGRVARRPQTFRMAALVKIGRAHV